MKQSKLFQSQQRSIPLGWLKMCKFRFSSCPSFPKSHSRLSSLSYNASSPNPPCVFPVRDALVHCLGVRPPPSTPMASSTVMYRANRGLGETQQPHTTLPEFVRLFLWKEKLGLSFLLSNHPPFLIYMVSLLFYPNQTQDIGLSVKGYKISFKN